MSSIQKPKSSKPYRSAQPFRIALERYTQPQPSARMIHEEAGFECPQHNDEQCQPGTRVCSRSRKSPCTPYSFPSSFASAERLSRSASVSLRTSVARRSPHVTTILLPVGRPVILRMCTYISGFFKDVHLYTRGVLNDVHLHQGCFQ